MAAHLLPPTVSLTRHEGVERHSGQPLVLALGVNLQNRTYLNRLAFAGPVEAQPLGDVRLKQVLRGESAPVGDAPLVLVGTRCPRPDWARGHWFFIPAWVNGQVELPLAPELLKPVSMKSDLKLIAKAGFEFTVTRDPEAFRDHNDHMHEPLLRRVHGEASYHDPVWELRARRNHAELLAIRKPGMSGPPLAGMLLLHEPTGPRLYTLGVRNGDEALIRAGIVAALYHFSFQHLHAQGHTQVHTGRTKPFLQDGLLRYKRKYGNRLTGGFWHWYSPGLALQIRTLTPGVKSFLAHNPFVHEVEGRLRAAVFTDAPRPLSRELLAGLAKEALYPGVQAMDVFCFQNPPVAGLHDEIPAELAGRLSIRQAAELV